MGEYTKPWNSVEQQIDRLAGRGVDVEPRDRTAAVLDGYRPEASGWRELDL